MDCLIISQIDIWVEPIITLLHMSVSSGMIRLPKATKTPVKSKVVPRQSLATIVKDLGENFQTAIFANHFSLKCDWMVTSVVVLLCSHLSSAETEGVQRTPNTHQQEPGQPASWGPKPAGEERLRQRQYPIHTHTELGGIVAPPRNVPLPSTAQPYACLSLIHRLQGFPTQPMGGRTLQV